MIKTSKDAAKRLIDLHGWSGVLLGLALYVVVFTGAIVVFSHEIGAWSVSGHKAESALSNPNLDETITKLSREVDPAYLEDVNIWQNSASYIIAFFHTHTTKEDGTFTDKGVRYVLDPNSLQVVEKVEGFGDDMPQVASSFLERFYIDLHVRLHAPGTLGLYLTGILGLVLLISAISGFIMHRHLIKDIFLSPRLASRIGNTRDRHNLAGAWGIIFAILLAFTGAFYSFATSLGLPVIAITAFQGDQQKAIETIVGVPDEEDPTPANIASIEYVFKQAKDESVAGSEPIFIAVTHMGRADSLIFTSHEPDDESMFFTQHQFSGVTGEYLGQKTSLGTKPSMGNTLVGLMGVLHFGWFAGLLSKIIWLALGLSVCYVILTGLELWVAKREKESVWRGFSRLVSVIGYGTPLAISTAALGFFIGLQYYPNQISSWTINGFFVGVALSFIVGFFTPNTHRSAVFQQLMGLTLIGLPLLRSAISTESIFDSISHGHFDVAGIDITLLLSGIFILAVSTGIFAKKQVSEKKPKSESEKAVV